jgi:flagellar FliL protein
MSTAAAEAGAAPAAGSAKGKKKLILIAVAAFVVLALAAVGALLLLKSKSAHGDEDAGADERVPLAQTQPLDAKQAPAYVPLEPFTVNLADRDADRYAQIAVTLELAEPQVAESIKAFMPAIRNHILMTLAHKTARELMERDGKERLAQDIRRDAARGMGMTVPALAADAKGDDGARKRPRVAEPELPVTAVYFSTFIVQ